MSPSGTASKGSALCVFAVGLLGLWPSPPWLSPGRPLPGAIRIFSFSYPHLHFLKPMVQRICSGEAPRFCLKLQAAAWPSSFLPSLLSSQSSPVVPFIICPKSHMLSVLSREQMMSSSRNKQALSSGKGFIQGQSAKHQRPSLRRVICLCSHQGHRNLHGKQSGLKTVFHLVLNPTSVQANALVSRNTMPN